MKEFFSGLFDVVMPIVIGGTLCFAVFSITQCEMANTKHRYEYLSTVDRTESHEYNSSPVQQSTPPAR